jgi:hypothetical protein
LDGCDDPREVFLEAEVLDLDLALQYFDLAGKDVNISFGLNERVPHQGD